MDDLIDIFALVAVMALGIGAFVGALYWMLDLLALVAVMALGIGAFVGALYWMLDLHKGDNK